MVETTRVEGRDCETHLSHNKMLNSWWIDKLNWNLFRHSLIIWESVMTEFNYRWERGCQNRFFSIEMVSRLPLHFSKLVCKGQNRSLQKIKITSWTSTCHRSYFGCILRHFPHQILRQAPASFTVYTACKSGGCTPTPFSLFSTPSL